MAPYIDFLSVFTVEDGPLSQGTDPIDLRFSSFREYVVLSPLTRGGLNLPFLGLGGRNYQLCYNLKCMSNQSKEENPNYINLPRNAWKWSPRQAVFHHQLDVEKGTSAWIITAARTELQSRIQNLLGPEGRSEDKTFSNTESSFISSLAVHCLLAQWASQDWRGYLRWLEQEVEDKTKHAIHATTYDPSDFVFLFVQGKEDATNKAIMMLNANAEILNSLRKFYKGLMESSSFDPRKDNSCQQAVADFVLQLEDFIQDIKMHSSRANALRTIIADRKNLVQQQLQAKVNKGMADLTARAQRDATVMKIIAAATFIYLPATFVSTFFSTDVVKYQSDGGDRGGNTTNAAGSGDVTSFSMLALERWIEVTMGLTAITLIIALVWMYWDRFIQCLKSKRTHPKT